MDKSWLNLSRISSEYQNGVEIFLDFAFQNASMHRMILCPCIECGNGVMRTKDEVREHLIVKGFIKGYTHWIAHGELVFTQSTLTSNECSSSVHHAFENMDSVVHDVCGNPVDDQTMDGTDGTRSQVHNPLGQKFYKIIDDWKHDLYPGCRNFSALSFILRLLRIKCLGKWSNSHFSMLLELLRDTLPEGAKLPKSFYEADKLMKDLGLGYEKIDACPNDCILYWRDRSGWKYCITCQESRWVTSICDLDGSKRKIPRKSLWHFPLKPRLQRLFMSPKTASSMRWHEEGRIKDGCLRHPADSPMWKTFDHQNPLFAKDSRNVRLGLASDGFNPFKNMSTSHSTWPVVLIPYNLPPWMCMKQPYFILSLLIQGPTAPGNCIDVYLEPLICELKELWQDGLETYDASCKKNFQMHAALLWTISDFPGYANLSGWSTKGKHACPVCHKHTSWVRLKNCQKTCYMGHRRYLAANHHKFLGMAPKSRQGLRHNFQLRDEHDDETMGSNGRGLTAEQDGAGNLQEELTSNQQDLQNLHGPVKKKTRGATYMKHVWGMPKGHKLIKVECNDLGQPIGETKSQFVEFLGTIAKNGFYAPIDVKSWPKMPRDKKNEMIQLVKQKFDIPAGLDYWILQTLGKRWRNWKSHLKAKHFNQDVPFDIEGNPVEERVLQEQWVNLVAYWNREEAQVGYIISKLHNKHIGLAIFPAFNEPFCLAKFPTTTFA